MVLHLRLPTSTDTLTHTYVKGGNVIAEGAESTDISVSNYAYAHGAREITVNTNSSHGLTTNDYVTLVEQDLILQTLEKELYLKVLKWPLYHLIQWKH